MVFSSRNNHYTHHTTISYCSQLSQNKFKPLQTLAFSKISVSKSSQTILPLPMYFVGVFVGIKYYLLVFLLFPE